MYNASLRRSSLSSFFSAFFFLTHPMEKKSRAFRVRSYLQSAWGWRLLQRLGGKGLRKRNAEPEEGGLRLLKSHQFDLSIQRL